MVAPFQNFHENLHTEALFLTMTLHGDAIDRMFAARELTKSMGFNPTTLLF